MLGAPMLCPPSRNAVKTGLSKRLLGDTLSVGQIYCLLQDCIKKKDLALGREVYRLIKRNSLESNTFLGSHLIRMFASCGSLSDAIEVFRGLSDPSVFSWGAIISAHSSLRKNDQAVSLYNDMCCSNLKPDGHVFVAVLKACADATSLLKGRIVHADVVRSCLELNVFVTNILVDMYCKCGSLEDAQVVFDCSLEQTVVTWSALLSGYVQHGHPLKALEMFEKMHFKGLQMDNGVLISTLQACARLKDIEYGKLIHTHIIEISCETDLYTVSTLVDMYAKCGHLKSALSMFNILHKKDVVLWNALIAGYAEHDDYQQVVALFLSMQEDDVEPDEVTFTCLLKGQFTIESLDHGRLIHTVIAVKGLEESSVVGGSLIDMYIKCGSTEDAYRVFDKLPCPDLVVWSMMIAGFIYGGHAQDAVKLSQKVRAQGLQLNPATFSCILKACSSIAALKEGKLVHADIMRCGCESDMYVASALIDMFAKCGSLKDARRLFDKLSKRDVVVWNAIIAGYAEDGDFLSAFEFYEHMRREGLKPDDATFACLLSACSHLGEVAEGCLHFNALRTDHGIEPTLDHYNSMVDLFGRAGHLDEAADILHIMPFQANVVGWTTLLNHCKTHGDLGQGHQCFGNAVSIDQSNRSAYVLMSRLYAHGGQLEDADKLEGLRLSTSAWKRPGQAFLEVGSSIYDFVVGDTDNPQCEDIYAKLNRLRMHMEDNGYNPLADVAPQLTFDDAL
eukprot:c16214_g1_i1 orf=564-2759(+)